MSDSTELSTKLVRLELEATHANRLLEETRVELRDVKERIAKFEGYWKVFVTTAGVLSALGLGLGFWVKQISASAERLPTISAKVDQVSTRITDLDKKREEILGGIVTEAGDKVVANANAQLQIPSGAVLIWWPEPKDAPIPAGWKPCTKELNGYAPQFDFDDKNWGYQKSFHAAEPSGVDANISFIRVRCISRR